MINLLWISLQIMVFFFTRLFVQRPSFFFAKREILLDITASPIWIHTITTGEAIVRRLTILLFVLKDRKG